MEKLFLLICLIKQGECNFLLKRIMSAMNDLRCVKRLILEISLVLRESVSKQKTGQDSIRVKEIDVLCKSLKSLPEKWHGLRGCGSSLSTALC